LISALIPARSGSERVPNKNILDFLGHPLLAYSILYSRSCPLVTEVFVSTDSETIRDIAVNYGVDNVILRPANMAKSTSLDIEWISHLDSTGNINNPYAAIVRPTSPLRSIELLSNMFARLHASDFDSIRTIAKVKEHPGKMWTRKNGDEISPLLDLKENGVAFHAMQYASLPEVFVQTSVLEIFKVESMRKYGSREGSRVLGYETSGSDSWAIDLKEDWEHHLLAVSNNKHLSVLLEDLISGIAK